ncbi:hypothetical protein J7M22_01105 [Candidatus Poribacteria bacterium]|nr:hypothetical protein [Candidatus Poribacteria bacterium]
MFRKQLGLIVASLMPVCVLTLSFLLSRSMGGEPVITTDPEACKDFYGDLFGREVYTTDLCPDGIVTYTREDAEFQSLGVTDSVRWHREQQWYFENTQPWGANYCYTFLDQDQYKTWMDGYWNGYEVHWRDGEQVKSYTDTYYWEYHESPPDSGIGYRCPSYRKYGGFNEYDRYYYNCSTRELHYPADWFEEDINYVPDPEPHGIGESTGSWYNCTKIE